jgi:hypothetical protein
LVTVENYFFAEGQLNISFFELSESMLDMHEDELPYIFDPDIRKTN